MSLIALVACGCHASYLLGQNGGDGSTGTGGAGGGTLADGGVGGAGADAGGAGVGGASGAPGTGGAPGAGGGGGVEPSPVSFFAARNYPAGHAYGVASGDVNEDGKLDLIASSDVGVAFFAGKGDGTFADGAIVPGSAPSFVLAMGDLNGDHHLDVVSVVAENVLIWLGAGDGTFHAGSQYAITANTTAVALGDMDGNGTLDIAVTRTFDHFTVDDSDREGALILLLNHGDATFTPGYSDATPAAPYALALGDLDGDGKLDVVVPDALRTSNASTVPDGVLVYFNGGNGQLAAPVKYAAAEGPLFAAIGDLNGDGRPDIAFSRAGDYEEGVGTGVLFNRGDRTFTEMAIAKSSGAGPILIADVDGDRHADVVANDKSGTLEIIAANGDGTFAAPVLVAAGFQATAMIAADLDRNGSLDLVTSNEILAEVQSFDLENSGYVTVLMNQGAAGFVAATPMGGGAVTSDLAAADFNRDGKLDVAIASIDATGAQKAGSVQILIGNGDATFTPGPILPVANPLALVTGDLDGDGWADLVAVNNGTGTVSVLLNRATAGAEFRAAADYAVEPKAISAALVDVDGDGRLDIAVSNGLDLDASTGPDASVSVLINQGGGLFAPHVDYTLGSTLGGIAAGDLDGDGHPELVVTNVEDITVGTTDVRALYNDPGLGPGVFDVPVSGTFTGLSSIPPSRPTLVDLDGDHKLDLITTNNLQGTVSVLHGDGTGRFEPAVQYAAGAVTSKLAVGDLNGDGRPDLAVVCTSGNVAVLLNAGAGKFAPAINYGGGGTLIGIAIGDVNGDGKPDLILGTDTGTSELAVLLNTSR